MTFNEEDIKHYQDLCRKYFGEEVDKVQAIEELNQLIFMVSLMYHPELQDRLDAENFGPDAQAAANSEKSEV